MRPSIMDLVVVLKNRVAEIEGLVEQMGVHDTPHVREIREALVERLNEYVEREDVKVGEVVLAVGEFVLNVLVAVTEQVEGEIEDWLDVLFYIVSSNVFMLKQAKKRGKQPPAMAA